MISASQIRAARSLLDWTQQELSKKSGISLRALNNIERGTTIPRPDNLAFIQQTLEGAGIEFGDFDCVRRRTERLDIVKLEGSRYVDEHLLDIMQETRTPNTYVLYNIYREEDFQDMRADVTDNYFRHLHRYNITERLLIAHNETYVISPPWDYRWLNRDTFNHVSYIVYGDNVAFQIFNTPHRIVIIRNPGIADMFRRQFEANWAMAELPWFGRDYKNEDPNNPWSSARAAKAREWIAAEKGKRKRGG